jgi:hypothetical protein
MQDQEALHQSSHNGLLEWLRNIATAISEFLGYHSAKPSEDASRKQNRNNYSNTEIGQDGQNGQNGLNGPNVKGEYEQLREYRQIKEYQIHEMTSKLTEIRASQDIFEEVANILSQCIKSLVETKENWKALLIFFEQIKTLMEQSSVKVCIYAVLNVSFTYQACLRYLSRLSF